MRERADRAENPVVEAYARTNLGLAALLLGRPEAARWLVRGIELSEAINHLHMICLHRSYLASARAAHDPVSALFALRVALVEYGAVRIPFGPRQIAAELIHHFAELSRWETVAALDGACPPVSLHPEAARVARLAARESLGGPAYERLAAHGRRLLHDEFAAYVHAELDVVGVAQHRARGADRLESRRRAAAVATPSGSSRTTISVLQQSRWSATPMFMHGSSAPQGAETRRRQATEHR